MSSLHDPERVLARAEARARAELDAARARLRARARGALDLRDTLRRHPIATVGVGLALGALLIGPARKLPAGMGRLAAPAKRLLAPLIPLASRAILDSLFGED